MADVIGKVADLEGSFFVKGLDGNLRELHNGDEVYAGETIVPDTTNSLSDTLLVVPADDSSSIKIDSTHEQLLDSTLLNEEINNQELSFNQQTVAEALILNENNLQDEEQEAAEFGTLDGAQVDVNSDLRKKEFETNDEKINKELEETAKFNTLDNASTDVNSDLRQANWPGIAEYQEVLNNDFLSEEIGGSSFALRDGASTNVVSDLRQAVWFQKPEEPEYNGEIDISISEEPEYNGEIDISTSEEPEYNDEIDIPVNYTPTAIDDPRVLLREEGSSVSGELISNDIPGGDGLISGKELNEFTYDGITYFFDNVNVTYTINSTLGELTVNRDGSWEINPMGVTITEHTEDNFIYKIIDSNGDISNSAEQPLIMFDKDVDPNIVTSTTEDTSKLILLNDTAGDVIITDTSSGISKNLGTNESIDITRTSDAEIVGTVTNNGDGTVTFIPNKHYSGDDAVFGYEVIRNDNTTIVNDSVTVNVTPLSETKTTDTDNDSYYDVLTQGDKTYTAIDESATYSYIPLTGLSVTNEDDRGNSVNPFASELTTVKLSGVPLGFKFKYNDGTNDIELEITNVNDGIIIPFEYIDTLEVKPTDFFAGEIKIEMRIITEDTETGKESTSISEPDYLIINVKNVANGVDALNAAQATGEEDAGRVNGNTTNDASSETITAPENGINLDIDATLTDTSGREYVTVIIDEIPEGGAIYYNDVNGTIVVNASGIVSGNNSNVTVINNGDNTFKVTISDFKNDAPLNFIPPHNSNDDYDFSVTAYSTDGESISSTTAPKTLNVVIDGVADIPVYDAFKKLDSNESINSDVTENIYSDVVIEDNSNTRSGATILFKDLYEESGLASYDGDSENLSIIITNLDSSISIQDVIGISFNGASGTSREWSFNVSDLDKVVLETSKNFSGDFTFKVIHTTVENDGDSKAFEQDVSILVKPLVEASVTTSSSATEDEVSQVSFTIEQKNGESNETLDTLWIKIDDITGKNFTLYYSDDNGSTLEDLMSHSTVDGDYYKLDNMAIDKIYIHYNSNVGSANNPDNSFSIKYTISDSTTTANNDVFTSTEEETSSVYNISLLSVTDVISVDTSNGTSVDNIIYDDGLSNVTINEVGSFSFDIDVTSTDTDNSENFTRIIIENVQRGITIDDQYATMGISGSDTNIWFLDIPNQELTGGVSSYTVNFLVDQSLQHYSDTSTVKITAYSHDVGANADDIQEATQNIEFINNLYTGPGVTSSDIDIDMNVNSIVVTEDTQFVLDGIIDISLPTGGVNDVIADTDSITYTLAFSDLENVRFDTTNDTYTNNKVNSYNGEYFITVTASKSDIQSSIETVLSNIKMISNENYNENNASTQLSFNVKLTAYTGSGYARDTTSDIPFSVDVVPVTDSITSDVVQLHVDEDSNVISKAQEDGTTTIKIIFDTVDNPDYNIVQGATDDTLATTIAISHTSGIYGTLTWDGGSYTFNDINKIANINIEDIDDESLKFTPTQDASGSANFTYTVYSKEVGATNISETTKDFTISVNAVADGLNLPNLSASGDEDTFIQIYSDEGNLTSLDGATQIDSDGSETIKSMFIDGVPEGFNLYIGDSHQTLATKGSKTGTVTIEGIVYDTYKWTLNISNGIPKVWIKAPEGWSSTEDVNLILDTLVQDGSDYENVLEDFTVSINSVVDGFDSVTPNDTVQTVSSDVAINLNAQAGDLDGSETGILTLSGFGANDVTFKQNGIFISSTYDVGSDTYTIVDINLATDKLNELTFQKAGIEALNISYTFKTVETDDGEVSTIESGTFTVTTDTVITNISTAGVVGETDRLELSSGGIDFSTITSTSIEKIDLTQNGDTSITNVNLADVLSLTDGTNDLIIIADDANDNVTFKASDGWSKEAATTTYGDSNFETYINSGDSTVSVKVSEEATVTIA